MSDWESYYNSNVFAMAGISHMIKLMSRDMAGQTHGGEKALAGMIPLYGYARRSYNEYKKAEDYYKNTGTDPRYSSDISNLTTPNLSQAIGGSVLPRMARSMTQLYQPEIVEDLTKMYQSKRDAFRESGMTADKWRYAWDTYNARYRR